MFMKACELSFGWSWRSVHSWRGFQMRMPSFLKFHEITCPPPPLPFFLSFLQEREEGENSLVASAAWWEMRSRCRSILKPSIRCDRSAILQQCSQTSALLCNHNDHNCMVLDFLLFIWKALQTYTPPHSFVIPSAISRNIRFFFLLLLLHWSI